MNWESFLPVLVMAGLAGLANWFQARAKAQEREAAARPRRAAPPRTVATTPKPGARGLSNMEGELRRILLGGDAPFPPRIPPSVVRVGEARAKSPSRPQPDDESEGSLVMPSPLTASPAAYARAQEIYAGAAVQVEQAAERGAERASHLRHRSEPATVRRRSSLGWLRNRQSARQGIIASLVLGPPKSLER